MSNKNNNYNYKFNNKFKGEGAKMILNFTQIVFLTLKFCDEQKSYPTWGPGANIIFSLEGHKSLFISKFYFPQVKILYLYLNPKFGIFFAPRETLVLETQF